MVQKLKCDYDFLIIDPASTEFNRGSFCYLPYILFNALSEKGYSVKIIENFTVADIDTLPSATNTLVSLWSYPQIDSCLVLNRFIKDVSFFGYTPLVLKYKLRLFMVDEKDILLGIINYPKYYSSFKYLLLSDCDMHLKEYEGLVYPLFTSYGCPKGCSFCPSSVNCNRTRIVPEIEDIYRMLTDCISKDIKNIHFTDEDFFFDIHFTHKILTYINNKGFKIIALGSVEKVTSFVETYGEEILVTSGVKLIEIGLETADEELAKSMHKVGPDKYEYLANLLKKVKIFWLTITFFPGETIKTLNNTGSFLRKYGHKPNSLYERIATNSTEGGLGQFFQVYDGVLGKEEIDKKGVLLSERPVRLIPSYVPYSFLLSTITSCRDILPDEIRWFNMYNINPFEHVLECKNLSLLCKCTDDLIFYAICARLGIIR